MRDFDLYLIPPPSDNVLALRQLRAPHLGGLVRTKGMVTRVSEVKPLVTVVSYTCDRCNAVLHQEVLSRTYMPLFDCTSRVCAGDKAESKAGFKGTLTPHNRGSKFVKFQELRLQELPDQVPIGHIPRSSAVYARGPLTRLCGPGDIITLDALYLPTPFVGKRASRAGLIADTYAMLGMGKEGGMEAARPEAMHAR